MSDSTAISIRYETNAEFAEAVNMAVLSLKQKQNGREESKLIVPSEEAIGLLIGAVEDLSKQIETGPSASSHVPHDTIVMLKNSQQGRLQGLGAKLAAIGQALREDTLLSKEQFQLLDAVCAAGDASASEAFRSLWRR